MTDPKSTTAAELPARVVEFRDELEQQAAHLELKTPEDKKALNEYLSDVQKNDVTPEYLSNRTKTFLDDLQKKTSRSVQ